MKNKRIFILLFLLVFIIFFIIFLNLKIQQSNWASVKKYNEIKRDNNPILLSALKQIGVVKEYDTNYYNGGYPPDDKGACSDVIIRALLDNEYNLKNKIDKDFKEHKERYDDNIDPNINFRRVKNIKIFLDNYAEKLTTEINSSTLEYWEPGDIVTYGQIPGGLWHIAIISDRKNKNGIPLLIHNHGFGTTENDLLLNWPSKISGHYRINL